MGKNQILIFLVALCLVAFFCAICVGYYENKAYEAASKIEYCYETNEKFYQEMVSMERNTPRIFDGFPTCLTSVFYSPIGAEILATPTDTLYFADRDLNRSDPNKYPYFVVKDNHNNVWLIIRHNDKYCLIRKDEKQFKPLLVEDIEEKNLD